MAKALAKLFACIYCGCTEERACATPHTAFTAEELIYLMAQFDVDEPEDLPDPVPCSWISEDPAVCSAPACKAKFRAARQAHADCAAEVAR